MRLSVVLSTYQHPAWLERVLWGYALQSRRPHQVIVADDGSGWETAEAIDRVRQRAGLSVMHVWHEHLGFRKCAILNEAIRVATGDYLLFSDGDCVPRRDFVATHMRLARPGRFLSGGTLRMPPSASYAADCEAIERGDPFRPTWLLQQGWRRPDRLRMALLSGRFAKAADAITTTRASFNGHNASAWKSDIVRANGFDERMEYGGLDRELGDRLTNAGIRGKQVRHRAVCVHLHHERLYVDPEKLQRNRKLRWETRASGAVWTPFGLLKAGDVEENSPTILSFTHGAAKRTGDPYAAPRPLSKAA